MTGEALNVALIVVLSMIGGWVLGGVVMWAIAELDERKWRKRMRDIMSERTVDRV